MAEQYWDKSGNRDINLQVQTAAHDKEAAAKVAAAYAAKVAKARELPVPGEWVEMSHLADDELEPVQFVYHEGQYAHVVDEFGHPKCVQLTRIKRY